MGLTICLQGEAGDIIPEVHDPKNLLLTHFPQLVDESYHCVRFIDPYGDTYFNRVQVETFLTEWDRVAGRAKEKESKELFARVKALAQQCKQEPHLYLKFSGD